MADKNYEVTPEEGSEKKKETKRIKMRVLEKKLQEIGTHLSIILELAVAVLVFAASIVSIIHLFPELYEFIGQKGTSVALIDFLEEVFVAVIGIEFLKMLCKPTSENVLETIIFLVARHMIINQTEPIDDLLSVIAIVLLVLVKRYLRHLSDKKVPFLDLKCDSKSKKKKNDD